MYSSRFIYAKILHIFFFFEGFPKTQFLSLVSLSLFVERSARLLLVSDENFQNMNNINFLLPEYVNNTQHSHSLQYGHSCQLDMTHPTHVSYLQQIVSDTQWRF